MTATSKSPGMTLLIDPRGNGGAINANTKDLFVSLVLAGWVPVGPNGKAAAAKILADNAAGLPA
jgi:hypothetical protein